MVSVAIVIFKEHYAHKFIILSTRQNSVTDPFNFDMVPDPFRELVDPKKIATLSFIFFDQNYNTQLGFFCYL